MDALLEPLSAGGIVHSAFYQFIDLPDPHAVAQVVRDLAAALTGSVVVATEGVNGAVAGAPGAVADFERALIGEPALQAAFAGMAFKRSGCRTPPYRRLKVHVRREIVALGLPGVSGPVRGMSAAPGAHGVLSPSQWREMLDAGDTVVLDNRNSFEFRLGRFRGAIDPGVGNFRDFPSYVAAHADAWRAQGRRVAMYCTGGIRCEKTAAWMQQSFGLAPLQLDGGILNYFRQMPDAQRDWQGECFVFDNRIALDTTLQETDTTAADVYADTPDEAWRRERALRLDGEAG